MLEMKPAARTAQKILAQSIPFIIHMPKIGDSLIKSHKAASIELITILKDDLLHISLVNAAFPMTPSLDSRCNLNHQSKQSQDHKHLQHNVAKNPDSSEACRIA